MPTEPSKSGAIFSGWWTARNGGGTEFTATTTVTADITVYAKWTPPLGSVQISLRPQDDPPLSNTALFVNESQSFSAGNGYASYQWYWNGAAISGATSADYTLAAYSKTTGIYELAVVVTTTTGRRLSARCRITIKAN
jgi:uncharacterized repeat protein (TIGR02543 family)